MNIRGEGRSCDSLLSARRGDGLRRGADRSEEGRTAAVPYLDFLVHLRHDFLAELAVSGREEASAAESNPDTGERESRGKSQDTEGKNEKEGEEI